MKRCFGCSCGSKNRSSLKRRTTAQLFEDIDISNATLQSLLGDAQSLLIFQKFLESRYMGETLKLYLEIDEYERLKEKMKPAVAKKIFHQYIDPENENPDTVTIPFNLVKHVQDQLESENLNGIFDVIRVEMLVLMNSNAVPEFLQMWHIPSLEECLENREYSKFYAFARDVNGGWHVEFMREVMDYENAVNEKDKEKLGSDIWKKYFSPHPECVLKDVFDEKLKTMPEEYHEKTFSVVKHEALIFVTKNVYPLYVRKIVENIKDLHED